MSTNTLKINILNLIDGEHNFDYVFSAADIGLDEKKFTEKISVNVKAVKSVYQLEILVKFGCVLNLECDRCLEPYAYDFNGEFRMYFKPLHVRNKFTDSETDDDNLHFYPVEKKNLDLTGDLRDYILLSLPMRKVPEEIDGVCVVCKRNFEEIMNRKNDNTGINPAWDKLLKGK